MITTPPLQIQNALRILSHAANGASLSYDGGDLWTVNGETMRSQEAGPKLASFTTTPFPTEIPCTLAANERRLLKDLETGMRTLLPDSLPKVQSLIDRGYCRTCKVLSGPLRIDAGDIGLVITEAGRIALNLTY